jgi:hypothetical protein
VPAGVGHRRQQRRDHEHRDGGRDHADRTALLDLLD